MYFPQCTNKKKTSFAHVSRLTGNLSCHLTEDAGSGDESDVLSINADTYDSDIEGHKDKDKQAIKPEETDRKSVV